MIVTLNQISGLCRHALPFSPENLPLFSWNFRRSNNLRSIVFVISWALGAAFCGQALASSEGTIDPFTIPQGAYVAEQIEDRDHLSIMSFSGNYDKNLDAGAFNAPARAVVAREFYKNHPDNYDFLFVFTAFEFDSGDAIAFYHGTKNDTGGIGVPIFDNTVLYGSQGKLQGVVDMAATSRYVLDPASPDFEFPLNVAAHEVLHRWAATVKFVDDGGAVSDELLGSDLAHWNFFLETGGSVEYGHRWRDNGDGTFTAVAARRFYSPLDLYLMGVYSKDQVPPMQIIVPSDDEFSRFDLPRQGVTVSGTVKTVTIDDIIAAEGPRLPTMDDAQKEFRFAFIYLVPPGTEISERSVADINRFRKGFVDRFAIFTGGQATAHVYPEALPVAELGVADAVASEAEVRTDSVSVQDALGWLRGQQDSAGFWQDKSATRVRDTSLALGALRELNADEFTGGSAALGWLSSQQQANSDDLARRLDADADGALIDELVGRQNVDGGWGLQTDFESNSLDTAIVLNALARAGADLVPVTKAVNFLVLAQNADGGWGNKVGGASDIQATISVSGALTSAGVSTAAEIALSEALAWLADKQNIDGGFGGENGVGGSNVHDTARALLVFSGAKRLEAIRRIDALQFVAERQSTIGDWDGSVYTTSLAVKAMQTVNLPNLAVTSLIADRDLVRDGDRVKLTAVVSNDSSLPAEGVDVQFFDGDPEADGVAISLPLALPVLGAYSAFSVDVFWDTLNESAEHALYAVVDRAGLLVEKTRLDNTRILNLTVAESPAGVDLELISNETAIMPMAPTSIPSSLAIATNLRNLGLQDANDLLVQLWLGAAGSGQLVDEQLISLPGRTTVAVNFLHELTQAGLSEFTIVADPDNRFTEEDEGNNVALAEVNTQPAIDLEVLSGDVQVTPLPVILHQDAQFDVRLRNRGTITANNVQVDYLIQNATGTQLLQSNTLTLEPGESKLQSIVWRADFSGDSNFIVEIDPANLIAETDTANNQLSTLVSTQQLQGANLALSFRDLQFSPNPAQEAFGVTLAATIVNSGTVPLTSVELAFYDSDPSNGGSLIEDVLTIPSIAAGESRVVQQIWSSIPTDANRVIFAVVDPDNQIVELNEDDNRAFDTLEVESVSDLAVSPGSIQLTPEFPQMDDQVSATVIVSNLGKQPANNVEVKAYLGLPAEGGVEIGTVVIPTVAGFGSGSAEFSFAVTQQGDNSVYVVVDPDGNLIEKQRGNNTATRTLFIQDGDFYTSERYISPGDDGVQDNTEYFFRLTEPATVSLVVLDYSDREIRHFDTSFENVSGGSVLWDGRNDAEGFVQDGVYRLAVKNTDDSYLGQVSITVDTNRSALVEAVGTESQFTRNLSCAVGDVIGDYSAPGRRGLTYSPDNESVYFRTFFEPTTDTDGVLQTTDEFTFHPSGLYRSNADGSGATMLSSRAELELAISDHFLNITRVVVSPDGSRLVFLLEKDGYAYQIWEINPRDGSELRLVADVDNAEGNDPEIQDIQFLNDSNQLIFAELIGRYSGQYINLKRVDLQLGSPIVEDFITMGSDQFFTDLAVNTLALVKNSSGDKLAVHIKSDPYRLQWYEELLEDFRGYLFVADLESASYARLTTRATAFEWSPEGSRIAVGDVTKGAVIVYDKHLTELQHLSLPYSYKVPSGEEARFDFSNANSDNEPDPLVDGSLIGRFAGVTWNPDGSEIGFVYEDYIPSYIYFSNYGFQSPNDQEVDLERYEINDLNGVYTADLLTGEVDKHAVIGTPPLIVGLSSYHVSVQNGDQWVKVGELHHGRHYSRRTLALDRFIPENISKLNVRITQMGQEEAHIDQIAIFDHRKRPYQPLVASLNGKDIKSLIANDDKRVVDALGKTIELTWERDELPGRRLEIGLLAREATLSHLQIKPFSYPSDESSFYEYSLSKNAAFKIDGKLSASENTKEAFSQRSNPDTGHPGARVSGYIGSDKKYLYGALDFGVDNTMGNPADWAEIEVKTAKGWKAYRVTEKSRRYGKVGFISSPKVKHEHKYYEFKVPLRKLGLKPGDTLRYRFRAYGSAGIIASDLDTNEFGTLVTRDGFPFINWIDETYWNISYEYDKDIRWLVGSRSLLITGSNGGKPEAVVVGFDRATPTRRIFNDSVFEGDPALLVSVNNRMFDYVSDDEFDACPQNEVSLGYRQFHSLLNLTADLRARRSLSASGIVLEGTASDKNFASYHLEFTDVNTPEDWEVVAPASQDSVVDDQFTTWVPPGEGSYLVRLTVTDLAGNTRQRIVRTSLSEQPSITGVYRQPSDFSPNGDGIQDITSLHFTVLEPVNLELQIFNDSDVLVRSISESYSQIGSEQSIAWDGRDNSGNRVAEGSYKMLIQGYEYFVDLDITYPNIIDKTASLLQPFSLNHDKTACLSYEVACSILIDQNLGFSATDETSLPEVFLDYRADVSANWSAIDITPREFEGQINFPGVIESEAFRNLGEWTDGTFRIRSQDSAGNTSVQEIPGSLKRGHAVIKKAGFNLLLDGSVNGVLRPLKYERPLDFNDFVVLSESRFEPIRFNVIETIGREISSVEVMYRAEDGSSEFMSSPVTRYVRIFPCSIDAALNIGVYLPCESDLGAGLENKADAAFQMVWDPLANGLEQRNIYRVFLRLTDIDGNIYSTNSIVFGGVRFGISGLRNVDASLLDSSGSPNVGLPDSRAIVAFITVPWERVIKASVLVSSTEDSRYTEPTILDAFVPNGLRSTFDAGSDGETKFYFDASRLAACINYTFQVAYELDTGETIVSPALSLTSACTELTTHYAPVFAESCEAPASQKIRMSARLLDPRGKDDLDSGPPPELAILTISEVNESGEKSVVFNVNEPEYETVYEYDYDVSGLPAGTQVVEYQVTDIDGKTTTEIHEIPIVKEKPVVEITAPLNGQKYCAVQYRNIDEAGAESIIKGLEIEGVSKSFGIHTLASGVPQSDGSAPLTAGFNEIENCNSSYFKRFFDNKSWLNKKPPYTCNKDVTNRLSGGNILRPDAVRLDSESNESEMRGLMGVGIYDVENQVDFQIVAYNWSGGLQCEQVTFEIDAAIEGLQISLARDWKGGSLYSPNGDGINDEIRWQITVDEPINLTLGIFTQTSIMLEDGSVEYKKGVQIGVVASDLAVLEGTRELFWDGRSAGLPVPDGEYFAEVLAVDSCGNIEQELQRLYIDNTAPVVAFTAPQVGDPVGLVVEFRGSITDEHPSDYQLMLSDSTDVLLNSAGLGDSIIDQLVGQWNTYGLEGDFTLLLAASDRAGNTSQVPRPLTLPARNDLISLLDTADHFISPNEDGRLDDLIVRVEFNTDVQATFRILKDGNAIRTIVADGSYDNTVHTIIWDGKDSAGFAVPDGSYLFEVIANDGSVSQIEVISAIVDSTGPVITITDIDDGVLGIVSTETSPFLSGAIEDDYFSDYSITITETPSAVVSYVIGSGEDQPGGTLASLLQAEIVEEGVYKVTARASDQAQNITEFHFDLLVDTTPPIVEVNTPLENSAYTLEAVSIEVDGSIVEQNLKTYTVTLAPVSAPESPVVIQEFDTFPPDSVLSLVTLLGINDDDYNLQITAVDKVGLTGTQSRLVVVDNIDPVVDLAMPLDSTYVTEPLLITGSVSDENIIQYEVALAQGETTISGDFSNLAFGVDNKDSATLYDWQQLPVDDSYTLRLLAKDIADNEAVVYRNIIVDTQPPAQPAIDSVVLDKPTASVAVNWDAVSDTDLVGYFLYRNAVRLNPEPLTVLDYSDLDLAEGVYRYTVSAVDLAGLESQQSASVDLKVDLTSPQVFLAKPLDGSVVSGLVEIAGTAFSSDDFKEYRLYAGPVGEELSLIRSSALPVNADVLVDWNTLTLVEGSTYSIRLEAEDQNDNVATDQLMLVINNTAPLAPLNLVAVTNGDDVELDWDQSDADVVGYLLYRNDRLVNAPETVIGDLSAFAIPGLEYTDNDLVDGEYIYRVFALDDAGNMSESSEPATVTIDVRAPHAVFTSVTALQKFENSLFLAVSVEDQDVAATEFSYRPVGTVDWLSLVVDASEPYAVQWDTSALAYGDYEVRAVATDVHNNIDSSPEVVLISKRDMTAPEQIQGLALTVVGGIVDLAWTASSEADIVGYQVYRSPKNLSQGPLLLTQDPVAGNSYQDTDLVDGEYEYHVVAVDLAGNISLASDLIEAVIFTPRINALQSPTADEQVIVSGETMASAQLSIEVEAQGMLVSSEVITTLADGSYQTGPLALLNGQNTIRAVAVLGNGTVSKTAEVSLRRSSLPSQVTGVQAVLAADESAVQLSWATNPESNIIGYRGYRDAVSITPMVPVVLTGLSSDSYSSNEDLDVLIDGDNSDYWAPEEPLTNLDLEWDEPQWIGTINIEWWRSFYRATVYQISVWDGSQYLPLYHSSDPGNNTGGTIEGINFGIPYFTNKIRIEFLETNRSQSSYEPLRMVEITVSTLNLADDVNYLSDIPGSGIFGYQISAVNDDGFEGPKSDSTEIGFGDVVAPQPVLISSSVTDSDVTIEWSPSTSVDVTAYYLYRDGLLIATLDNLSLFSYVDSGLVNGTYSYILRPLDAAGNLGDESNTAVAVVAAPLISAPTALSVVAGDNYGLLNLSWQPAPGSLPASYSVYRSMISGSGFEKVQDLAETAWVDKNTIIGTQYFYYVTAYDAFGNESAASSETSGLAQDNVGPLAPLLTSPAIAGTTLLTESVYVTLAGNAEPGSVVKVLLENEIIDSVTATSEITKLSIDTDSRTQIAVSETGDIAALVSSDLLLSAYVFRNGEWQQITELSRDDFSEQLVWAGTQLVLVDGDSRLSPLKLLDPRSGEVTGLPPIFERATWINSLLGYRSETSRLVTFVDNPDFYGLLEYHISTGQTTIHPLLDYWDWRDATLSSDESHLSVLKRAGSGVQLWLYDLDNRVESRIDLSGVPSGSNSYMSLDWSQDDEQILVSVAVNGQGQIGIYDVQPSQFTLIAAQDSADLRSGVWSPDGNSIAYSVSENSAQYLEVLDLSTGEKHHLFDAEQVTSHQYSLAWTSQNKVIATRYQGGLHAFTLPGGFTLDELPLAFGTHEFTAFAEDAAGNVGANSEASSVTRIEPDRPDISLSMVVNPMLPHLGSDVLIELTITNSGQAMQAATDTVIQVTTPEGITHDLLVGQVVPALAESQSVTFTASWSVDEAGDNTVVAKVDLLDVILERNESNNILVVDVPVVVEPLPFARLSVDSSLDGDFNFGPNQQVDGSVSLTNAGDTFSGVVRVLVEDSAGFLVTEILSSEIVDIAYGDTIDLDFTWLTEQTFAGVYTVRTEILDGFNQSVSVDETDITIAEEVRLLLALVSDKASYEANESVRVSSTLANNGGNTLFSGGQLQLRILDSNNVVMYETQRAIGEILPGDQSVSSFDWDTQINPIGQYHAELEVIDAETNESLISSLVNFNIRAGAPQLTGVLILSEEEVGQGLPLAVDVVIANHGNAAVTDAQINISILDNESGVTLTSESVIQTIPLAATASNNLSIETGSLALGRYQVRLSYQVTVLGVAYDVELARHNLNVVDVTAPIVTLLAPQENSVINSEFGVLEFVAEDAQSALRGVSLSIGATANVWADEDPIDQSKFLYSLNGLSEGSHTVVFSATDEPGNTSNPNVTNFTVDNTGPILSVAGVEQGEYYSAPIVIDITAEDPYLQRLDIQLNDQPYSSGSIISADGDYRLVVEAEDTAGNASREIYLFAIDTVAAMIDVTGIAENGAYNHPVMPVIDVIEPNIQSLTITLNGEVFVSGTELVTEGSYDLLVEVVDGAGNTSSLSVSFELDLTVPDAPLVISPANSSAVSVSQLDLVGSSEPNALITMLLNDTETFTTIAGNDGSYSFNQLNLIAGANSFGLTATDRAGNISALRLWGVNFNTGGDIDIEGSLGSEARVLIWAPARNHAYHPHCSHGHHSGHVSNYHHYGHDVEALTELIAGSYDEVGIGYEIVRSHFDFKEALRSQRFNVVVVTNLGSSYGLPYLWRGQTNLELRAAVASGTGLIVFNGRPYSLRGMKDILGARLQGHAHNAESLNFTEGSLLGAVDWVMDGHASRLRMSGGQAVGEMSYSCSSYGSAVCTQPALSLHSYGKGDTALIPFNPTAMADQDNAESLIQALTIYASPDETALVAGNRIALQWRVTDLPSLSEFNVEQELSQELSFVEAINGSVQSSDNAIWSAASNEDGALSVSAIVQLPEDAGDYQSYVELFESGQSSSASLANGTIDLPVLSSMSQLEADLVALIQSIEAYGYKRHIRNHALYFAQHAINIPLDNRWQAEWAIFKLSIVVDDLRILGETEMLIKASELLRSYQAKWSEFNEAS